MSFANKYNSKQFNFDTKDFPFVKLCVLYKDNGGDVIHPISGLYVHRSKLGDSPVIIDNVNKRLVNLPNHMSETVRTILGDNDAIADIKANKVGFTIYTYESHGKTCYNVNFVDL